MEIRVKIKASHSDMSDFWEFDEVINPRYVEKIKEGLYSCSIRIPECELEDMVHPISLATLKKRVVEACKDDFPVVSKVEFSNGVTKTFYSPNDYWRERNKENYAELFHVQCIKETIIN